MEIVMNQENKYFRLEKILFWDYGEGALDILPPETVAQRIVDRWAAIHVAHEKKEIKSSDVLEALIRVDKVGVNNVIYCESVREYVIKAMIEVNIYHRPKQEP